MEVSEHDAVISGSGFPLEDAVMVRAQTSALPARDILFYGFNQDATCLTLGLRSGYRIYSCRPFVRRLAVAEGGVGLVEMLFCTSLVALVGAGDRPAFSPRLLRLWNTKRAQTVCETNLVTAVLAVRLNRRRVVVCLERALYIFDISNMACLQTLETTPNPNGIVALSSNEENCYLAFPNCPQAAAGSSKNAASAVGGAGGTGGQGEVMLYDANTLKLVNKVMASRNPVAALAFSRDGALLASASEQGTVVRVFSVPEAHCVVTLRRGTSRAAVHSLAFNAAATRLAVSSSSGTVHVFRVLGRGGDGGSSGRGGGPIGGGYGNGGENCSADGGFGGSGSSAATSRRHGDGSSSNGALGSGGGDAGGVCGSSGGSSSERGGGSGGGGSDGGWKHKKKKSGFLGSLYAMTRALPRSLPHVVDFVDGTRSFAHARLRAGAGRSVCALVPRDTGGSGSGCNGAASESGSVGAAGSVGTSNSGAAGVGGGGEGDEVLLVATAEGILYTYAIDGAVETAAAHGGGGDGGGGGGGSECRLERVDMLLETASEEIGTALYGHGGGGGGGGNGGGGGRVANSHGNRGGSAGSGSSSVYSIGR